MSLPTLLTFVAYLIALMLIGSFAYRATGDLEDYLLGGRRLGVVVTALSAGASDMSGWLLLGLPGAIYVTGLGEAWIAVGLLIGAFLNWRYVAKPLRIYTMMRSQSLTLPDFLERRFLDTSKVLRVISALIILLFFTFYTASGLVAGAKLFSTAFDLSYYSALWIGAIVIVGYTSVGGFLAVSWTDVLQGLMMLFALLVVPVIVVNELGGLSPSLTIIDNLSPAYLDPFSDMTLLGTVSLLAWGLGYFGQPHILARFMAISDANKMGQATLIGMSWMFVTLVSSVAVGLVGLAYFSQFHVSEMSVANSEKVFIILTQLVFNPWLAGALLAAILAAVMSTIDSQLLVSSSCLTQDFYRSFLRPEATEQEMLWTGRLMVLAIAMIAIFIASDPQSQVLSLVSYAWGGLGAGFGPVILLSLYWRRMTRNGAVAGMVTGALTVIVWKQLSGGVFELYELFPGFVLGSAAIVVCSLFDKDPQDDFVQLFDTTRPLYLYQ
ncbi:MAG: sodium/proline symporter PutP [Pseudomonadales bacterium]|jgi:sodium/proline symporter|nr:sodium/proline symporter PutP [Pseudomonadales bacterium]MDP7357645.1 sodium/proline symporter PutP [Pseudomonadales bacterium]MDP7598074.1 sodium/proline symporter PutP [Pseudomonadales bacterium]HJN50811.1 sodium/proline symporter PutP [Pseudomonadales bacterium]|tara:strand:+ start:812 stop:2293 length:1482 start_codon:yes stop_codon:yes gene_type:complete